MSTIWVFLRSALLWKLFLPFVLVLLTLVFGATGFRELSARHPELDLNCSGLNPLLYAAGLPLLNTTNDSNLLDRSISVPLSLQVARVLGVLIPPYAFLLLLGNNVLAALKRVRIRYWQLFRLPYAVVCGAGWKGREIARSLRTRGSPARRIVVVEKNEDHPHRGVLESAGVLFMVGDATSPDMLRKAGADRARLVYAVCDTDAVNGRIVQVLQDLPHPRKLQCLAHVTDPRQRQCLAEKGEWEKPRPKGAGDLQVVTFSMYESTARILFEKYEVLRRPNAGNDEDGVCLIAIIGRNPMARAILLQALKAGVFKGRARLRLLLIDCDIQSARELLFAEFPCLDPRAFQDNPAFRRYLSSLFADVMFAKLPASETGLLADDFALYEQIRRVPKAAVFLSLDEGFESAALGAIIREKLTAVAEGRDVDVFAYYSLPDDQSGSRGDYGPSRTGQPRFEFFDDLLGDCSYATVAGMPLDLLAKEISALYAYKYSPGTGAGNATSTVTEWRQVPDELKKPYYARWSESSEDDRDSNRQAADHVKVKLWELGLKEADIGPGYSFPDDAKRMLAEMEHRRWCIEKCLKGFVPFDGEPPLLETPGETPAARTAREGIIRQQWKAGKSKLKKMRRHLDLRPLDRLSTGEAKKDYDQIEGIPFYLVSVRRKSASQDQDEEA